MNGLPNVPASGALPDLDARTKSLLLAGPQKMKAMINYTKGKLPALVPFVEDWDSFCRWRTLNRSKTPPKSKTSRRKNDPLNQQDNEWIKANVPRMTPLEIQVLASRAWSRLELAKHLVELAQFVASPEYIHWTSILESRKNAHLDEEAWKGFSKLKIMTAPGKKGGRGKSIPTQIISYIGKMESNRQRH